MSREQQATSSHNSELQCKVRHSHGVACQTLDRLEQWAYSGLAILEAHAGLIVFDPTMKTMCVIE
eukprot:scaffold260423_cov10-Prasinocladus_malaysianus.AAC.1